MKIFKLIDRLKKEKLVEQNEPIEKSQEELKDDVEIPEESKDGQHLEDDDLDQQSLTPAQREAIRQLEKRAK